jgi:hypothetical protein
MTHLSTATALVFALSLLSCGGEATSEQSTAARSDALQKRRTPVERDTAARDTTARDTTARDTTPRDTTPRDPATRTSQERRVPARRVAEGNAPLTLNSGLTDSLRLVLRSQTELTEVWGRIWQGAPAIAAPSVNFERDMVVVAALGQRMSGGYGIFIDSVYTLPDAVEIVIRKTRPGNGCMSAGVLTAPVDAALIPLTSLPLRFREKSVAIDCG